jgi:zinc transport system substrate-binding protein
MVRKEWRVCLIFSLIIMVLFSGCSGDHGKQEEGKLNVVTTFYPLYDFAVKIGGEHAHVVNLVPVGVDPHEWTPKPQDMARITQADLFIYNGAGFEVWMDSMLHSLEERTVVVEASRDIDLIRFDHHGDHGHEDEREQGHEDRREYGHDHGIHDPHIWLSPKRAMTMADHIRAGFVEADPDHRDTYEANYLQLIKELENLDQKLEATVKQAKRNHIVVTHSAFQYLAHDYGLEQVSVMGISPDAEPTAGQLQKIASFIQENDVQYILFEELASPRLAEILAEDLGIEILVLNPLEGLTDEQLANGEDYFSIMEKNVQTLAKALE